MPTELSRIDPTHLKQSQRTAYEQLKKRLDLNNDIPYTPDWSASPDFLLQIANHCLQHKPELIVECSSGTSSYILARCCQLNQKGSVISLEHELKYAKQTDQYLKTGQLQDYANIVYAPLATHTIFDDQYQWYDIHTLELSSIDMLVIDGPPGYIQKQSRYPALPLLSKHFRENCVIYMDDANREDELTIVNRWKTEWPYNSRHTSRLSTKLQSLDRGSAVLHCV